MIKNDRRRKRQHIADCVSREDRRRHRVTTREVRNADKAKQTIHVYRKAYEKLFGGAE
jgi:hypothetical protein